METLDITALRSKFPRAYDSLPAKLVVGRFTFGCGVLSCDAGVAGKWIWKNARKWVRVDSVKGDA